MTSTQIKNRVISYLEAHGAIPGNSEEERLRFEHINSGLIDSLGIVKMIFEFEREFRVHFLPVHMQSDEFQTVGGLIDLIVRLSAEQGTPAC